MTADLKKLPSLDEMEKRIGYAADCACETIKRIAEDAKRDFSAYAGSLGNTEHVSDMVRQAEVAYVNDVTLSEGSPETYLSIRGECCGHHLISVGENKHLSPGRKRILFFILPMEW